jgi:tetratricopeptide (TPR) repeat protein
MSFFNYSVKLSIFLAMVLSGWCAPDALAQPVQATAEYQTASQFKAQAAYESAADEIKKLIGDRRYHAAAMVELGRIRKLQAESEMTSAMSHFYEAAEAMREGLDSGGVTGPELPKTLYNLGQLYEEKLKNYLVASEIYEELIINHPAFLSIDKVHYHLGNCYELTGRIEEAVEQYKKVVTDYSYSSNFAIAQEKMKQLAVGTSYQDSAIEAQMEVYEDADEGSDSARASLDLGDMQAEAGNFSQAVDAYRRAADMAYDQGTGVKAYRKMINVLDNQQKDYEGAANALEEMLRKYPDAPGNEEYIYRLGRIYESDIDSLKTQVIDGRVRYRKSVENVRKAIDYYNSVTEKFPDADISADAFFRKGELYEKEIKDYDKARRSYEEFLRRFPFHGEADKVRQRLQEIEDY